MESLKGKLTEEEMLELFNNSILESKGYNITSKEQTIEINVDQTIKRFKKRGWIKQNPVEKARDSRIWIYERGPVDEFMETALNDMMNAIDFLEKKLEEKK